MLTANELGLTIVNAGIRSITFPCAAWVFACSTQIDKSCILIFFIPSKSLNLISSQTKLNSLVERGNREQGTGNREQGTEKSVV
jgi:hypothetical protein